jgi:hypothetical protein
MNASRVTSTSAGTNPTTADVSRSHGSATHTEKASQASARREATQNLVVTER